VKRVGLIIKEKLKIISLERLIICLIVALVFFYVMRKNLLLESLDLDEIINWSWITGSWNYFWIHISRDTQGIAYYGILKLVNSLFPLKNDYWIRVPSLFMAIAMIIFWMRYWLRKYEGNLVIVVALGLLYLTNPLIAYISTYARYSILLFSLISILSTRFFDYLQQDQNEAKYFSLGYLDVFCIGLIINTNSLGVIWLFSWWITSRILKINIDFGFGNTIPKKVILAVFSLCAYYVFINQLNAGANLSWATSMPIGLGALLFFIFGQGFYYWAPLIFLQALLERGRASIKFKFNLTHLILVIFGMWAFLIINSTNLFIFRYYLIILPIAFLLQEEVLIWLGKSKSIFRAAIVTICLSTVMLSYEYVAHKAVLRTGAKQILLWLKKNIGNDLEKNQVACIFPDNGFTGVLKNYSTQYFSKDICSSYDSSADYNLLKKAKFLIAFSYEDNDIFRRQIIAQGWKLILDSGDRSWMLYATQPFTEGN
jgi:hypothetical protein